MTFGETLKFLRKEKKITIEQLATEICVSRQSIIDYESNRKLPMIDKLKSIAEYFNVSTDFLIYGENRVLVNPIESNNIKTVLLALGTMLNSNLLEVKNDVISVEPVELIARNNIIKCYLIDYLKMLNRIDGYCTKEEKDKILLLLSEKY